MAAQPASLLDLVNEALGSHKGLDCVGVDLEELQVLHQIGNLVLPFIDHRANRFRRLGCIAKLLFEGFVHQVHLLQIAHVAVFGE